MNNSNNYSNGRVNIIQPDPSLQFSLYDKISCDSKATEYRDPLKGNWKDSTLSITFFSADNIQILQNGIRAGVYKKSKGHFTIGPQCTDTLKIIMRSVFLSYSANKPDNIQSQVAALNQIVLDYCIPQVYGEAQGYLTYLHDVSNLAVPMQRPTSSTYKTNTLEPNSWI